jgi:Copper transport outer membrane protein, MctB
MWRDPRYGARHHLPEGGPELISFRFLLVSLVSVFLALGLGVLAGTTALNQGLIENLENQQRELELDRDMQRQEIARLSAQVDSLRAFPELVMPYLIEGELLGHDAVLLSQEGTDPAAITQAEGGLREAGAEVRALLVVGRRMALPSASDREALAEILGADPATDPSVLKSMAVEALAERLAFGPQEGDIIDDLIREEFLVNQGPPLGEQGLRLLETADMVVVVGGGLDAPAMRPESFLVPLVTQLGVTDGEKVLAAAESMQSAYEFVTLVRDDQEAAALVSTQDNVDQIPGTIGLVLALEDRLNGGDVGHYGSKDGATALIPPPSTA